MCVSWSAACLNDFEHLVDPANSYRLLSLDRAASCQVIIFSFSKKECEALALQMVSLDLNDEEEAGMVSAIFSNAIDCLSEEDRRLPQVAPCAHIAAAQLQPWIATIRLQG